jgi:hypothetical protein
MVSPGNALGFVLHLFSFAIDSKCAGQSRKRMGKQGSWKTVELMCVEGYSSSQDKYLTI